MKINCINYTSLSENIIPHFPTSNGTPLHKTNNPQAY